ncbi:PorP/SprF family type IX secretion system membrane protein [Pedobacter metabolipauper]|uniref:Type IX secretion system PorP/SprF family membrane protein n=1 Tax=Pedobacter metabolipauper TaxID=425513 RepID=A0A4R6SWQ0_9SPHI|nr:PorP/SprF family type IX secretion system membrane protein [Pedobacter metabolipauper]TDQ10914.1 type IX secretion system PorP/SprF family membrane protein [Pedobacter metabolipauper]
MNKINIFLFALLLFGFGKRSMAQLNPLGTQYYFNQYAANPAMAGIRPGMELNLGMRKQFNSISGSPTNHALTAQYRYEKVGLGLNMYSDLAGLLKQSRVTGTYAYHLPISKEGKELHFGLSLGMMYQRISADQIDGDADDGSVMGLGQRETYFDGDFGVAYTSDRFTIQAAMPNMRHFFQKEDNKTIDQSLYLTAISYKWYFSGAESSISFEPKLTFRAIKGYDNLIDAGANISLFDDKLWMMAMYHSSKSATMGLGINYGVFSIMGMYTSETAALRTYADGSFEIGLVYRLFK